MNRQRIIGLALAGVVAASAAAVASVTFDPVTGIGFVGKGDVQLIYGWNNKSLQDNAANVQFQASSVTVSEATWTCDRDAGPQTQERTNTTTTTTQGVVTSVARERNQVTGFILAGYAGAPTVTEDHDGPAVGSCPTFWTAVNLVVSDPVPVPGGGLQVSIDGFDWYDLQ